ncbi:MAG: hypothetical protein GTO40_17380 [Deltaproteobacteria bacterium]|nr:hypothetical protein [Deltaproteobacteria bacterium]
MADEIKQIPGSGKLFCLGLPKTGTTSLYRALRALGYRAFHNPEPMWERLWNYEPFDGNWQATCHFGFWHFEYFERKWPNSRYIYLDREDRATWLESTSGQFLLPHVSARTEKQTKVRLYTFQGRGFDEQHFRSVYERHKHLVADFFGNLGSEQSLVWDLTKNPDWEILCRFLREPAYPDAPFPHENFNKPMRDEAQRVANDTGHPVIFTRTDDGNAG